MHSESTNEHIDKAIQRYISRSPALPFVAIRESDFALFEYVPLDVSFPTIKVVLPPWLREQERLRDQDLISLNTSYVLSRGNFSHAYVSASEHHFGLNAEIVTLRFSEPEGNKLPIWMAEPKLEVALSLPEQLSIEEYFLTLLKDILILKKGINIYFSHLVPLFSRVLNQQQTDFKGVRTVLFEDVGKQLLEGTKRLEVYRSSVSKALTSKKRFKDALAESNFEEILSDLRYPLPFELFTTAIRDIVARNYLTSIKHLERRKFITYNVLTSIYVNA